MWPSGRARAPRGLRRRFAIAPREGGVRVYVCEAGGRAVAAFNGRKEYVNDEVFRADLMVLESEDGVPLWDGETPIGVREADAGERAKWLASRNRAVTNGLADSKPQGRMGRVPGPGN